MSFEERQQLAKKVESLLDNLLAKNGIEVVDISYERIFKTELRNKMRPKYDNNNILHVRFQPDRFAYLNNDVNFFLEYKICSTPIKFDSRVKHLQTISKDYSLNKKNIGAIEASAYHNYYSLVKNLDLKVALLIYCPYHEPKLVIDWVDNIKIKNESEVILGHGNASRTPYVNINLGEFKNLSSFFKTEFKQDFNFNL